MAENSNTTTLVIVILVIIVILGFGWWYFASNSNANYSPTTNNNNDNSELTTLSSQKDITAFNVAGAAGNIDSATRTITVTVPKGTDVKNLTPTISVSQYASVSPASGEGQDFTNPVTYTVTAQDASTQTYTVKVNVSST